LRRAGRRHAGLTRSRRSGRRPLDQQARRGHLARRGGRRAALAGRPAHGSRRHARPVRDRPSADPRGTGHAGTAPADEPAHARRGEQLVMPERVVTVYRFRQLWREQGGGPARAATAAFEIECAAGTYVRSLIADLGDAYCLQLRRIAIGPFDVRDAVAPPRRGAAWPDAPVIALQDALAMLPAAPPH